MKPPAKNFLQQQAKFDRFIECYNHERPHQALNMKYPAELYRASPRRPYRGLPDLEHPFHDRTITVTSCGRVVPGQAQSQLESCFCWPSGRHQGGRREDLAGELHALRLRVLRSRDGARRMRAESLPGTGVTYVSGIIRYLSNRNGPVGMWRARREKLQTLLKKLTACWTL